MPLAAAALLLAAGFASNAAGIKLSSRIQLVLMVLLVALLALAVAVAASYARAENFEPFAPRGYSAVGGVAILLFFCFAGWEAVTHLAAGFRTPGRNLKRGTWLTLVVVGVVYIGVVAAAVAVPGPDLPGSSVPVADLLQKGLGPLSTGREPLRPGRDDTPVLRRIRWPGRRLRRHAMQCFGCRHGVRPRNPAAGDVPSG
jgi:amino acid efflux transporter